MAKGVTGGPANRQVDRCINRWRERDRERDGHEDIWTRWAKKQGVCATAGTGMSDTSL